MKYFLMLYNIKYGIVLIFAAWLGNKKYIYN